MTMAMKTSCLNTSK